jgi:hypothetical protein
MDSKNLKLAKLGFDYLEIYLNLCEWSIEKRSLVILCSQAVEDELLTKKHKSMHVVDQIA